MTARIALFPGTFDPPTNGHVDLVRRGRALFDAVVVAVVADQGEPWFDVDERIALFRRVLEANDLDASRNVLVAPFRGLVVRAARDHGACCLLRGIRGALDWDFEMRMAFANRDLDPAIDTVFLPPSADTRPISASLVREVFALGGDVGAWVHPLVVEALERRRAGRPGGGIAPPKR